MKIPEKDQFVATFSIVGYDPENGEWGVAVIQGFCAWVL